jgi:hypothetical protein
MNFIVLNATFNNISAISWRSVSLVEETRVPGENHRSVAPDDRYYGRPGFKTILGTISEQVEIYI